MKSIIGLALALGMCTFVNAQGIPTLAKVYAGNTAETSINASKKNPKTQTQNVPATLTTTKQDGLMLNLLIKTLSTKLTKSALSRLMERNCK